MNRVCLIARLVRDVELRDANGTPVANLRVAWNTKRKGEDRSHFADVTVFGKTAELCAQYLSKGREAAFDGRLEMDEWEQDGNRRQKLQIVADNVKFIGSRDGSAGEPSTGGAFGNADPPSDDIPFAYFDLYPLDGHPPLASR